MQEGKNKLEALFGKDMESETAQEKQLATLFNETVGDSKDKILSPIHDGINEQKDLVLKGNDINPITASDKIYNVPLKDLIPNPRQMRGGYSDGFYSEKAQKMLRKQSIRNLAASIDSNGLLQPITITTQMTDENGKKKYCVVSGHQRVLAFILLGKDTIPAIPITFLNMNGISNDLFVKNISENFIRNELNPIELSAVVCELLKLYYAEEVGKKLGISKAMIKKYARLRMLDAQIRDFASNQVDSEKKLSYNVLYTLSMFDTSKQRAIFKKWLNDEISTAEICKMTKKGKTKSRYFNNSFISDKGLMQLLGSNDVLYKEFITRLDGFVTDFIQEKQDLSVTELAPQQEKDRQE